MKRATLTPSRITADLGLEGVAGVSGVTFDGRLVWLVDRHDHSLLAVDPETRRVARRLGGLAVTSGLTWDGRHLWGIAGGTLLEIDPESGEVLSDLPVPSGASGLAWAGGAFWVGRFAEHEVVKIDARTGAVLKTLRTDRFVTGVTFHGGELWIGAWESDDEERPQASELWRLDEASGGLLERVPCAPELLPSGMEATARGEFWVGHSNEGRVCGVRSDAADGGRP